MSANRYVLPGAVFEVRWEPELESIVDHRMREANRQLAGEYHAMCLEGSPLDSFWIRATRSGATFSVEADQVDTLAMLGAFISNVFFLEDHRALTLLSISFTVGAL